MADGGGERKWRRRNNNNKADLADTLRKSWYRLRLSVRHPSRVPTWDAVVLTAASPEQAKLYEWQLSRAKRLGRIAPSTVTLAVPDPDGRRIGSGAATLHAIRMLALHYQTINGAQCDSNDEGVTVNDKRIGSSSSHERFENGISHLPCTDLLAKKAYTIASCWR